MLDPELVPESLADEAWVLAAQMGSDLLLVRPELLAKASAMPAPRAELPGVHQPALGHAHGQR